MERVIKNRFLTAVAIVCAAILALAISGCAQNENANKNLRVAVLNDIPGMSYYNEDNGRYYGLEVDIAVELASRLGYADIQCTGVAASNIQSALSSLDVDAIIACFSPQEERKESFDFSEPYYTDELTIVVEKSTLISSISDLSGKTIGTLANTSTAKLLEQEFAAKGFSGEMKYKDYSTPEDLSNAIESGEVDAMASDGVVAKAFMHEDRQIVTGLSGATEEYAVATEKGSELSEKIDAAIKEMNEDGTIAGLIEKWG